ncbi:M48 family metalloprotease [Methanocella arvoryzae]|uniref:Protease HtpX homolog n=1 Tax=Methanocella arvoryzae (strain DSM 22066 / NBRC 105507 / MRE50) TaxID=351160 RepID=Q0W0S3_METAR|nr:M48 family metalloprotease [Methanocella arvoryzae]CAJ38020.1 putative peptidase (M48 family) [Methanocella arvoryzae MRE50]
MSIDWGFTIRKFIVYGTLFALFALAILIMAALGVEPWLIAILSGGFLFVQYFFSDKLVLWSTGAKIVSESEAPRLHMMIESLCTRMNLPKPRIAIVSNDMPNAFATGRSPKKSVVAVTTGILGRLNERELEAVLAHELSHVKHRDMFVVTFASFIVSVLSWVVYIALSMVMRGEDRDNFAATMAAWMVSMVFSNTIGLIIINTVSRYREYGADEGAAYATGSPDNLISALKKISGARYSGDDARGLEAAKALCISSTSGSALMELFSTHPPMEKRIARLEQIRTKMRGY